MTVISDISGHRVWDSRGRPTVKVDVQLKMGLWAAPLHLQVPHEGRAKELAAQRYKV